MKFFWGEGKLFCQVNKQLSLMFDNCWWGGGAKLPKIVYVNHGGSLWRIFIYDTTNEHLRISSPERKYIEDNLSVQIDDIKMNNNVRFLTFLLSHTLTIDC